MPLLSKSIFTYLNPDFTPLYIEKYTVSMSVKSIMGLNIIMSALAKRLSRSDVKTRFLWLPQVPHMRQLFPPLEKFIANPRVEIELLDSSDTGWSFIYGAYTTTTFAETTYRYYLRDRDGLLCAEHAKEGYFLEIKLDIAGKLRVGCSKTLSFVSVEKGPWRVSSADLCGQ